MEFLPQEQCNVLSNPGVTSMQLLSPHNSASHRVTIARVLVERFEYLSITSPPINFSYVYDKEK